MWQVRAARGVGRRGRGRTDVGSEKGKGLGLCILHTGTLSGPQLRSDKLRSEFPEDDTAEVICQQDGCGALSCGVSVANPLESHGEFPSSSRESQDAV